MSARKRKDLLVALFDLTSLLRVRYSLLGLVMDPFGTRNFWPAGALDGGGKDTVLRSDMFRGLFSILSGSVALEKLA